MNTRLSALFLVSCILSVCIAFSIGFTCDGVHECGFATDQCCPDLFLRSVCYNPITHHCVNIEGTAQLRLCGITDSACSDLIAGKVCYDPTRYDCVAIEGGTTLFRRMCPTGFRACGENAVCFDPDRYNCCGGSICGIGSPGCDCTPAASP